MLVVIKFLFMVLAGALMVREGTNLVSDGYKGAREEVNKGVNALKSKKEKQSE